MTEFCTVAYHNYAIYRLIMHALINYLLVASSLLTPRTSCMIVNFSNTLNYNGDGCIFVHLD